MKTTLTSTTASTNHQIKMRYINLTTMAISLAATATTACTMEITSEWRALQPMRPIYKAKGTSCGVGPDGELLRSAVEKSCSANDFNFSGNDNDFEANWRCKLFQQKEVGNELTDRFTGKDNPVVVQQVG